MPTSSLPSDPRDRRTSEAFAEGCWLAALVVVPVVFHTPTVTVFEPDKAAVLRSLALLLVGAGLAAWLRGGPAPVFRIRRLVGDPVVVAAALVLASHLLSTAFSVDPGLSLRGTYARGQGLLSLLAYLVVFAGIVVFLRGEVALRRLLDAVVLASVPVAVYGLCQAAGFDPVGWTAGVAARPTGQAGNPIFLAAHLVMAAPVTLALAVEAARASGRGPSGRLRAAGYGLVLLLQAAAVAATGSRGPLLGLLAGTTFFALLALGAASRRARAVGVGVVVAGAAALVLLLMPGGPLEDLRTSERFRPTIVGRLGGALDLQRGTVAVRLEIWDGMLDLFSADPGRLATGWGPETVGLTHLRHYAPRLSSLEGSATTADRAHNRTLEVLATRGLPGLLTDLGLFAAVLWTALAAHGLPRGRRGRRRLLLAVTAGGVAGATAPVLIGRTALAGPLPPLGAVAGLLVFLLAESLRPAGASGGADRDAAATPTAVPTGLVVAGVAGAALGHFVETQMGIATVTTRLHLWAGAGFLVVARRGLRAPADPADEEPGRLPGGGPWGVLLGLALATAAFGFVNVARPLRSVVPVLGVVGVATLLAGLLHPARAGRAAVGRATAWALSVSALFLAAQMAWLGWTGHPGMEAPIEPGSLGTTISRLSATLPAFTLVVFGAVGLFGVLATSSGRIGLGRAVRPAAVIALASPVAWLFLMGPIRADVFANYAEVYERRAAWETAVGLWSEASERRPGEPRYRAFLARTLLSRASDPRTDRSGRRADLVRALAAADAARGLRPEDPRYTVLGARIETRLGATATDPEAAAAHFARADRAFREAVEAAPRRPPTWVAWGRSLLDRGRPRDALEPLERARGLDPDYPPAQAHLGEAHLALGRWEDARDAYRRAVELEPSSAASWRGLGSALAQLDERVDAVNAYLRAVERGANDVLTYRNLALMLGELGRLERAIDYGERALEVAPPSAVEDVRHLLEQLREISAGRGG